MWTHLPLIFSRSLAYLSLILFLYLFVLPLCAAIVLTDCQLNSEFHLEALGLKLGFFFFQEVTSLFVYKENYRYLFRLWPHVVLQGWLVSTLIWLVNN